MSAVQGRAVEHEGRSFVIPAGTVALDRDDRLALAIVTSGAFTYGGRQIAFSLEPGACDLSLMHADRCPLLSEHLPHLSHLLGSVVAATIDGGELRCLCRFARNSAADEVWDLLSQGFPLSLSAGGEIVHAEPGDDGVIRAVRWRLTEISVVVRGRDERAHIRQLEIDEDAAAMLARMNVDDPDGLGKIIALRRKYRLDDWLRWSNSAGPRLARMLGVDAGQATEALAKLKSEHVRELERGLAA